jgi:hypothetical protein
MTGRIEDKNDPHEPLRQVTGGEPLFDCRSITSAIAQGLLYQGEQEKIAGPIIKLG